MVVCKAVSVHVLLSLIKLLVVMYIFFSAFMMWVCIRESCQFLCVYTTKNIIAMFAFLNSLSFCLGGFLSYFYLTLVAVSRIFFLE